MQDMSEAEEQDRLIEVCFTLQKKLQNDLHQEEKGNQTR